MGWCRGCNAFERWVTAHLNGHRALRSEYCRSTLQYSANVVRRDRIQRRLPSSLVLKLSRNDVAGRLMNLVLQLHREGRFYQTLAAESPLRIPHCYFSSTAGPDCAHATRDLPRASQRSRNPKHELGGRV